MSRKTALAMRRNCEAFAVVAARGLGLHVSGFPRGAGFYFLFCIALLLIAAWLRFDGLSHKALWYDEILAAENAGYTISDLLERTRERNSSPLLYPFILYFVQKLDVSAFSLRIVPATASFLTVAALLFLLPRVGVDRVAAFVAASLATVSVNAINHAQDVREYSIDSLVAVLMIAGLLTWLRDGRKRLFCASLVVAPLLQYNLVLFGIAVFATAIVMRRISLPKAEDKPENDWAGGVARLCRELFLPGVCFLLACGVAGLSTALWQWRYGKFGEEKWHYLTPYYYMGDWDDPIRIGDFISSSMLQFFSYLFPEGIAIVAAVLLAAAAGRALFLGSRLSVIPVLFIFSLAIAIIAAVFELYPLGGIRMALYLAPVLYLAVGHSVVAVLKGYRPRCAAVVLASTGAIILSTGLYDVARQGYFVETLHVDPRWTFMEIGREEDQDRQGKRIWALVNGQKKQYADIMLADEFHKADVMRFYWRIFGEGGKRSVFVSTCDPQQTNMIVCLEAYARRYFPGSLDPLHRRTETLLLISGVRSDYYDDGKDIAGILHALQEWRRFDDPQWIVPANRRFFPGHPLLSEYADPQALSVDLLYPDRNLDMVLVRDKHMSMWGLHMSLYRIENFHRYYEPALERVLRVRDSDRILIRSSFDVYLREGGKIVYIKEPCAEEDTRRPFYLHIFPKDVEDIPEDLRKGGFDSWDFPFSWHGARYEGRCVIEVDLPDYDIARIRAGQYVRLGGDNAIYFDLWRGEAALPHRGEPERRPIRRPIGSFRRFGMRGGHSAIGGAGNRLPLTACSRRIWVAVTGSPGDPEVA